MPLQTSGKISHGDIKGEFGGTGAIGLSNYYGAAAGIPSSGTIKETDFYGKSNFVEYLETGITLWWDEYYNHPNRTHFDTYDKVQGSGRIDNGEWTHPTHGPVTVQRLQVAWDAYMGTQGQAKNSCWVYFRYKAANGGRSDEGWSTISFTGDRNFTFSRTAGTYSSGSSGDQWKWRTSLAHDFGTGLRGTLKIVG